MTPPSRFSRAAAALGLALFAAARLLDFNGVATRMDTTFFVVIGVSLGLLIIPLDQLKSFKAAGIEVTLELPAVRGAIDSLGLDRVQNRELRDQLARMSERLPQVRGSRVLWIDDRPHNLVGERRLLRALGIEVTSAISTKAAERILRSDNDFDLLLSDVQRLGETYLLTGGVPVHEGVNFVVKLRTHSKNPAIRSMPVIFYAAYDYDRLEKFTKPVMSLLPRARFANSVADLMPPLIDTLIESRSKPIAASEKKRGTSVGKTDAPDA